MIVLNKPDIVITYYFISYFTWHNKFDVYDKNVTALLIMTNGTPVIISRHEFLLFYWM